MAGVFDEHFSVNRSDKYDVLEKIGEGAFGEVRSGIDTQSGCSVAMKYVRMGGGRGGVGGVPRAVFREMEALKQVSMGRTYSSRTNVPWCTSLMFWVLIIS